MRDSVRTCIGCRRRDAAGALVRLRVDVDGAIAVATGTGRGASMHANAACVESALRAGALGRAFKRKVALPDGAVLLERLVKASLNDGLVKAEAGQI
jgi:predicted RNA-binding protein YlxR (DUF448 family)